MTTCNALHNCSYPSAEALFAGPRANAFWIVFRTTSNIIIVPSNSRLTPPRKFCARTHKHTPRTWPPRIQYDIILTICYIYGMVKNVAISIRSLRRRWISDRNAVAVSGYALRTFVIYIYIIMGTWNAKMTMRTTLLRRDETRRNPTDARDRLAHRRPRAPRKRHSIKFALSVVPAAAASSTVIHLLFRYTTTSPV